MEANLDDQTGEALGYVMQLLLDAGALDVYFTPIQMKKNRPATKLSVLIQPAAREQFVQLLLQHTSTIGVRYQTWQRTIMQRHFEQVMTTYGSVQIKVVTYGEIVKRTPEYADCARLAQQQQVPLMTVYQAALQQVK
ncbi:LarC family nickel insertion protein [Loigolactobacillus zhaoyuanensis]|uniref:LarC family nickel insertion protein n=1 Tax=Loigolactobacillus zhaoyuanensis TaxID=2486017 RepID=A0ABW8UDG5_9LACO|nr:LarC family nickel insertion protein [Loigolactobacillus zhaoyuanensis]